MTIQWRIYYADGTTFCSEDGQPEDAPPVGVLAIVCPDPAVGRLVVHGFDWYYFNEVENVWYGADIHGMVDALLWNRPFRALKQGRNVSTLRFRETLQEAIDDDDFSFLLKR